MTFETIRYGVEAGLAKVTLARPQKLNAFDAVMVAEVNRALELAIADPAARVIVITGEGRAFSSGQDLTVDLPKDANGAIDLGATLRSGWNKLVLSIDACPKPTVAAINGPAVGAALNMALACDMVVAARSAYLTEIFSRIALLPDAGGTWLLPRIVGQKRALAMALTGDRIDAETAERWGLVWKVLPDDNFAAEVDKLLAPLATGPALAYTLIKRAFAKSLDNDLATQLELEAVAQAEAGRSADFLEAAAAFREKRPPRFTGR